MQQEFTLTLKSWVYAYFNVIIHEPMHDKFCAGLIHFNDVLHLHPEQDYFWHPEPLPDGMLKTHEEEVEFWCGVRHWCNMVLFSRTYNVLYDGVGTGSGGVGLAAKESCSSDVIVLDMIGLLEPCTREQSEYLLSIKFRSLYLSHEDSKSGKVQVLFGPASLLNNDNASIFTFMDKKYLSNRTVKWNIPCTFAVGDYNWEVLFMKKMKGVYLHSIQEHLFSVGDQIFVNYQDPNYIDLTNDSDYDDEENVSFKTPSPKKRRNSYHFQLDAIPNRVNRNTTTSSGSSFDFGTSSSSQNSHSSDGTYSGQSRSGGTV